jgi:hypothetical protein
MALATTSVNWDGVIKIASSLLAVVLAWALRRRYPLHPEVEAELEGIKAEQARRMAAGLPQDPRLEDPLRVLSERQEHRAWQARRQDRRAAMARRR